MSRTKDHIKTNLFIFGVYFIVIAIILLQYPLKGSFTGNMDIWCFAYQMNHLFNQVMHNAPMGTILYPETDLSAIIDSAWGVGILYLPLKLLFGNDVWVFYFLTVIILSLNSWSFAFFSRQLGIHVMIGAVIGLLFSMNNFTLSQLENFNSYAFYPALLSGGLLIAAFKRNRPGGWALWMISALLAGFQLYISIYLFVFQCLLFLAIVVYYTYEGAIWSKKAGFISWALIISLLSLPFLFSHAELPSYLADNDMYRALMIDDMERHSIKFFKDFFRVNRGNILYEAYHDISNPWRYAARSAFFGISAYLMGLVSLAYLAFKKKWKVFICFSIMIFTGMMISTGPYLQNAWYQVWTPLGIFNKIFPESTSFRHVFRAHHITIASVMLLIAYYLNEKYKVHRRQAIYMLYIFAVIFLIENVPFNPLTYKSDRIQHVPDRVREVLSNIEEGSNIFFLPSCHDFKDEALITSNINPVNREYIYGAWKNQVPYNIYNGRLAYVTTKAFENTQYSCDLTDEHMEQLLRENNIDAFIVIPDFFEEGESPVDFKVLYKYNNLVDQNDFCYLFVPKPIE